METFASESTINQIKEYVKSTYNPTRLFLYGLRDNENYRADSDFDFVMVLSSFDAKKRLAVMNEIAIQFRHAFNIDVQVWTYSEADFLDWKDEFSSIPETALNTGIEIDLNKTKLT